MSYTSRVNYALNRKQMIQKIPAILSAHNLESSTCIPSTCLKNPKTETLAYAFQIWDLGLKKLSNLPEICKKGECFHLQGKFWVFLNIKHFQLNI